MIVYLLTIVYLVLVNTSVFNRLGNKRTVEGYPLAFPGSFTRPTVRASMPSVLATTYREYLLARLAVNMDIVKVSKYLYSCRRLLEQPLNSKLVQHRH